MKKTIMFLLPFFIGCSFQVKDTANEEERLSRRFIFEDESYGEFKFDKGFSPYEYEEGEASIDRSPRELTLFEEEEDFKVDQEEILSGEGYYKNEATDYYWNDELKVLEKKNKEIDSKFE